MFTAIGRFKRIRKAAIDMLLKIAGIGVISIECSPATVKQVEAVLKKRQYAEPVNAHMGWRKGFVKVVLLDSWIEISHNNLSSKGMRCLYYSEDLNDYLNYMERINA